MGYRKISNNKYKISIELGRDIWGIRRRKTEDFNGSLGEVKIRDAELTKMYYKKGEQKDNKEYTFKEYANIFLEEYCKYNVSKITIKSYKQVLSKILPYIGNIKLKNIDLRILNTMYQKLRIGDNKQERSTETLLHFYRLMNVMLEQAVKMRFINSNPNRDIKKPRREKSKRTCYNMEQVSELLECLEKENIKYKTLITFAIESGARRSEICALKWDDIDFNKRTIRIDNSLKVVNGIVDEEKPKNDFSCRTILMSESCMMLLRDYKRWQDEYKIQRGTKWKEENRVFTSINGTHIHPDTCGDILDKIIKKNNLPKITFHELRHTSTSILINNGINIKSVSSRLGHSNINTTMNIYAHSFDSSNVQSANLFDNLLKKAPN